MAPLLFRCDGSSGGDQGDDDQLSHEDQLESNSRFEKLQQRLEDEVSV